MKKLLIFLSVLCFSCQYYFGTAGEFGRFQVQKNGNGLLFSWDQPDYTEFDSDLILLINGNLMTLAQNGVGKEGFRISGRSEIWSDFFGDYTDVELAKTFIYLKTRVIFDPPTTSAVLDAYNNEAKECLWRCLVQVENGRQND